MSSSDTGRVGEARASQARAVIYAAFATAIGYPDAGVHAMLSDATWIEAMRGAVQELPFCCQLHERTALESMLDGLPDDAERLGSEYIALFESAGGPPVVSLYSGEHQVFSERRAAVEDVLRFYNHFGLAYNANETHDMPDQLSTELEFLHYLASQEAACAAGGGDGEAYRRAARDFLRRHLLPWLLPAMERIEAKAALPVYPRLFAGLVAFVRADAAWLAAATGEPVEVT